MTYQEEVRRIEKSHFATFEISYRTDGHADEIIEELDND